ncbi:hypothetical protein J2X36_001237 [Methylobacterium sp. BE186]|uniref:hypothetical protein n=1 Tax=Methylobacterium sp. BE186 TaxID=2817715 RepID=UPI00285A7EAC|nr:hypothetical protein [Methylobacterium sp. BE186]MDR7036496.1 hypothetical protein [Methylobacterium sp. BE186]
MVAITRGTSASETFNPASQEGSNPFGEDSSLVYGNGGNDRFFVLGTQNDLNRVDIVAGSGNDTADVNYGRGNFLAGAGNDTLVMHHGVYQYDADAGTDTLAFDDSISSYSIFAAGAGTTIFRGALDNPDLYVQSAEVETFRFSDVTVNQGDGNQLVDDLHYLSQNLDVAAAGLDPEAHYAAFGWKEGRDPNLFFDTKGYLAAYGDVAAAGINPLEHYLQYGWKEGRDPSAQFDTSAYLAANPDVAAAGINPLGHYLTYGVNEGRAFFNDGIIDV